MGTTAGNGVSMVENLKERGLRVGEVAELMGVSRSLVWKLDKTDQHFPKGARIGRARVWLTSEIVAYMTRRRGK